MSAILKFDFQKREQLRFSEVNYLNYTKNTNFAYGNYIFPKTRENKNKPWTHSTPLINKGCNKYTETSKHTLYKQTDTNTQEHTRHGPEINCIQTVQVISADFGSVWWFCNVLQVCPKNSKRKVHNF